LGDWGGHLHDLAHGIDPRAVTPDRVAKSIGHEHTFGQDVAEREHLRWWLLEQTEDVARRVRQHGLRARGVTVKLRYGDFETITRSTTLTTPTDRTEALWAAASGVFDAWCERSFQPLRLIGMSAGPLSQGDEQMGLFTAEHDDRQRQVDATLDKIAERFGRGAVKRGPTRG
jgi:DNA polymerase-4